jgi:WD40 repeat protein
VWDVETWVVNVISGPFTGHTESINSVAFSPNGKYILSGSDDNTIRLWDAETGQLVSRPFRGHTAVVCSVTLSPDGKHIVSGSDDKIIRVWDAETGDVVSGLSEGPISLPVIGTSLSISLIHSADLYFA